jgi:hypothetical protein
MLKCMVLLSTNAAVTASRLTPKYIARAADKREAAKVREKSDELLLRGNLSGINGNSTIIRHDDSLRGDALCARGVILLGSNEKVPEEIEEKESIITLPLTTRAYLWAKTTRAGLTATRMRRPEKPQSARATFSTVFEESGKSPMLPNTSDAP